MTAPGFGLETIQLDLPALVGAFSVRLGDRGLSVSPDRSAALARALALTRPISRRRLYWTFRAVLVSDPGQVRAFDAVFAEVFGAGMSREIPADAADLVAATDDRSPAAAPSARRRERDREAASLGSAPAGSRRPLTDDDIEVPVPTVASDEEVIRTKRFDALDAGELARLYALMARLELTTPRRLTRRRRGARRGAQIDLRRTLRASLRTGGEPLHLARRARRLQTRRIVLLCDISGSMEPYARAYLQFLACAVGAGTAGSPRNEAFVFATRLTRLTRALQAGRPDRALAAAAAAAPDWSSGTRIGDALQTFNDRHGRRGMARGAVVVIISDGWERGDPSLVGRELARLSRLAYRIVWVNPRVAATGFAPRAGGMAAALPHCDALVSGHSLQALEEVADAIGADHRRDLDSDISWRPQVEPETEVDEPWASAIAWTGAQPGSSVAMPSGYGPARGRTTQGWTR